MPEVKTKDYQGNDRRNGSGKVKLTLAEWVRLTIWGLTLLLGATTAWVTLKGQVNANAQEVAEACVDIEKIKKIDKQQTEDILTLQNGVGDIKKDVDEVKQTSQENQKLLYKILGKMDNG